MTGGEIAAAALTGKVVRNAGKAAAEESKSIRKELLDHAKQTPQFDKAARSYATRLAIRQEILTSMYRPIAKMLGVAGDYFKSDFEKDMGEKLAGVPEEHLTSPKPSLAAPAMQQLGFSLGEPDLKEMYLNLLATASDARKRETAHPSFVEVIKQLSANEVRFLEYVLEEGLAPLIRVKVISEGAEGYKIALSHVVEKNSTSAEAIKSNMCATYIDNWVRLGLITVEYGTYLTDPDAYAWVDRSNEFKSAVDYFSNDNPSVSVEYERGLMTATAFGKAFAAAVN